MLTSHRTAALCLLLTASVGCAQKCGCNVAKPAPLGSISDSIWRQQEANAEASDFVIHEHEFVGDSAVLNKAGKQHLNQIAARAAYDPFQIIVEPSSMSAMPGTEYEYPVHGDDSLDTVRRDTVVVLLESMGVPDAQHRVIVAPALTPGYEAFQAEGTYGQGLRQNNR